MFILFFIFLYIANLSFMSTNITIYYLSDSLTAAGYSKLFTGFILAIPRFIVVLLGLFIRIIADKFNKMYLSMIGFIFSFISFLGFAFATESWMLVLYAVINGLGILINMSVLMALVMDYTPVEKRGKIVGFFATSASLGAVFGPFLTDILKKIFPGHDMLSGSIFSLIGFISLCFVYVLCSKMETNQNSRRQIINNKIPKLSLYLPVVPLAFISGSIFFTIMNFTPSYISRLAPISYFLETFGAVAVVMRLAFSKYFSLWNRQILFSLGLVGYLIPSLILMMLHWFPSAFLVILAGAVLGVTHGIIYPNLNMLFPEITPNNTGNANFVFVTFFMMGGGLSAPLFGVLADYVGYHWMYFILFISIAICSFYLLLNKNFQVLLHELNQKAALNRAKK